MAKPTTTDVSRFLGWGLIALAIIMMTAVTAALYLLILFIVGGAIALAAATLGNAVSHAQVQHGAVRPLHINYYLLALYFAVPVAVAASMPRMGVRKATREKLRITVDQSSAWLVKFGELILIAAVFQLAAQKMHLWPIQVLSFLMFLCLAWHTVKPVWRFITWPTAVSSGRKNQIGILIIGVCFVGVLVTAIGVIWSLTVGLKALVDAGIVSTA